MVHEWIWGIVGCGRRHCGAKTWHAVRGAWHGTKKQVSGPAVCAGDRICVTHASQHGAASCVTHRYRTNADADTCCAHATVRVCDNVVHTSEALLAFSVSNGAFTHRSMITGHGTCMHAQMQIFVTIVPSRHSGGLDRAETTMYVKHIRCKHMHAHKMCHVDAYQ
jgi:hypothetical protein